MHAIDWVIIILYFAGTAAIGLFYAKRGGQSMQEFFLSGRNLPWWIAGTSMVATTFAADTPLAVTELVAKNGIAGNWFWWNFVLGGMLTVFFFARLWRRAGIVTDVEFVELRYSGKAAAFLRGFRSVYLGIFMNCIVMGWVNLAMASVLEGMFDLPKNQVMWYVAGALAVTAVYSAISGLWGVAMTDVVQFVLAMLGSIILAIIVIDLPQIGGLSGLREKLPEWTLQFTPTIGSGEGMSAGGALTLTLASFLAFVGVQWWASWYPGSEPGGGGYIAQRMMSAKDERHSLFATLWFTVAHYCVRPWPWILVGLASLILYPDLPAEQKRLGYVYAMRDYLPVGLKGLLVAGFLAAYMSTISTQLNWGCSYVINDLYKRFLKPEASEKSLVAVSRITTILIMAISMVVTSQMKTISGAWTFIIEAGAGLGLVLILRWFWWRINAWSEITAMIVPLLVYGYLSTGTKVTFPNTLFVIVSITTVCWVIVTFVTPPVDRMTLINFYRRVHPGGVGWKDIAAAVPEVKSDTGYWRLFACWLLGTILVYGFLFGTGKVLLGATGAGVAYLAVAIGSGFAINALYRTTRE
jgi:SSS family solute:Na+ symporter